MAATLGSSLMSSVLGHSDAEKAFRPWWDTLEDFMIYTMVMLGLIVIPTAMIMGTPLDCNYCQKDHCGEGFMNLELYPNKTQVFNDLDEPVYRADPGFSAWWAKKYCTLNGSVKAFMLYFPYILLISALILVLIERIFLKIFKAGLKMEKFYNLLIRQKVLGKDSYSDPIAMEADTTDGGREAVEVRQSFRKNNNYYYSYLIRTLMEIIVATALLLIMCIEGFPSIIVRDTIHCDVHGYFYECSGAPHQFYLYILWITVIIDALYVIANLYNLLWLICPGIGELDKVMNKYRENLLHTNKDGKSEEELLGDLYHIYYNNRDLRLLLGLLATSSGIAPAIAIIALFDKPFQNATKPTILNVNVSSEMGIARVEFQEPKTGVRAALHRTRGVHLMYVAEIVPPTDTAVKAFELEEKKNGKGKIKGKEGSDIDVTEVVVQAATFTGLKPDVDYKMKVSTVVNGRTISQVSQEIKCIHETVPETLTRLVVEDAVTETLSRRGSTASVTPLELKKIKKAMEEHGEDHETHDNQAMEDIKENVSGIEKACGDTCNDLPEIRNVPRIMENHGS